MKNHCETILEKQGDLKHFLDMEAGDEIFEHLEKCETCQRRCDGAIERLLEHDTCPEMVETGRNSYLYQAFTYLYDKPVEKSAKLGQFLDLLKAPGKTLPCSDEDLEELAKEEGEAAQRARTLQALLAQRIQERAWEKIAANLPGKSAPAETEWIFGWDGDGNEAIFDGDGNVLMVMEKETPVEQDDMAYARRSEHLRGGTGTEQAEKEDKSRWERTLPRGESLVIFSCTKELYEIHIKDLPEHYRGASAKIAGKDIFGNDIEVQKPIIAVMGKLLGRFDKIPSGQYQLTIIKEEKKLVHIPIRIQTK